MNETFYYLFIFMDYIKKYKIISKSNSVEIRINNLLGKCQWSSKCSCGRLNESSGGRLNESIGSLNKSIGRLNESRCGCDSWRRYECGCCYSRLNNSWCTN
jgi:hypothetical protein